MAAHCSSWAAALISERCFGGPVSSFFFVFFLFVFCVCVFDYFLFVLLFFGDLLLYVFMFGLKGLLGVIGFFKRTKTRVLKQNQ